MDHLKATLYDNMKKKGLLPGGVQLQLITSAGMSLKYQLTPYLGPEFLQDGGQGQKTESATQTLKVQPRILLPNQEGWNQAAFRKIFAMDTGSIEEERKKPDADLSQFVPHLDVYAPVAIPPAGRFS